MFIIYHEEKTTQEMIKGIDLLETILEKDLFSKELAIIKTDRGSEFKDAEAFEKEENEQKSKRNIEIHFNISKIIQIVEENST